MRVLDLCSGLGGASEAFVRAGDEVTRVDNDPRFAKVPFTVIADVRTFDEGVDWDVILASPPCTEFSRTSMPWHPLDHDPSVELVDACRATFLRHPRAVRVMENVRGAERWIGKADAHRGSRYFWGDVDLLSQMKPYGKWRLPPSPDRAAIRSAWPFYVSQAIRDMAVRRLAEKGEGA